MDVDTLAEVIWNLRHDARPEAWGEARAEAQEEMAAAKRGELPAWWEEGAK